MSSLSATSLCDGTTSSTSDANDPSIASKVSLCLRLFDSAIMSSSEARTADLSFENLRDQLGRFRLWSNEVGAHTNGNKSLQHQLCDAPRLRQGIIDLLQDLSAIIEKIIQIIEGKTPSWENLPDSDDSDSEFDTDELAERSDSDDNQTELGQLYTNIVEINTCLMRTSASTENPASDRHSVTLRDEVSRESDVTYKIDQIRIKFPKAPQYLLVRLAVAYCARIERTDPFAGVPPFVRRPASILFPAC